MWGLRTENEFSIFQPENARFHALGFQRFLPGGRRGKKLYPAWSGHEKCAPHV